MGLPTITVPQYTLTIPSTEKEIKFRPFLVKEEKILLLAMEGDEQKQIVAATKEIVQNCIFGDIDVETMPAFDLEYIFLQLRGKAKGEVLELKYKCPQCEGEIPLAINLDDVKVIKHKDHTNKIQLTEELGVVMKYPDLELQEIIGKTIEGKSHVEGLFETIVHCIDYIYDTESTYPSKDHTKKELNDFLESLTDDHFQKISKFFDTLPALKHDVELKCPHKVKSKGKQKDRKDCGYTEKMTLEGLGSFFA